MNSCWYNVINFIHVYFVVDDFSGILQDQFKQKFHYNVYILFSVLNCDFMFFYRYELTVSDYSC